MIISASRRTDLPAAHPEWLMERFHAGEVLVRNPMNRHQVSRISLRPEDVDGVVFWTKNPAPFMQYLNYFRKYAYYFQFTLNGYGPDVETNLPGLEKRLDTFLRLSEKLGPERVLWRYDPILLNGRYTSEWHLETFRRIAERLNGATKRATISFVDEYSRNKRQLELLRCEEIGEETMRTMAWEIAAVSRLNGMHACSCAEEVELIDCGVAHASCVDAQLLAQISGFPLKSGKDPNQRSACGCAPSTDIGAYNTCPNGCRYCYANYSQPFLQENLARMSSTSPILCDQVDGEDKITTKPSASMKDAQLRMDF